MNPEATSLTSSCGTAQRTFWYIFQVKDRVPDPVSRLRKMPNVEKRYILFVPPHYPVEAVGGDLSSLGVDNPRKVLLKLEGNEACLLQRLFGIVARGRKDAILDAFWDGGALEVVNARLERLCVPVEQIPGLAGQSEKELRKFEIDPQGSAIYWPKPDVHYDWKHLTWTVDPSLELRETGKSPDFYKRYGKAVRAVREAQGRRQSDIPGLSARQVRRIEEGESRLMVNSLSKLAAAHGLTKAEYVRELNRVWSPE